MAVRIILALLVACASIMPAYAADAPAENPDTGKPFANVWRLRGDVFATSKLGVPRKLREGGTVFVGEQVRAAPNSEAVLKAGDDGIVAVRPGAEFVPERFAAAASTKPSKLRSFWQCMLARSAATVRALSSNSKPFHCCRG